MAEKFHQQAAPFAPANGYTRSDAEDNREQSKELRRKKRMKCLLYVVLFAVFQTVGTATVPKSQASLRSTKKFNLRVDLSSANIPSNSELGTAINSGVLALSSQSTLQGKVELFKVMKKKKSTQLNCNMNINLNSKQLENVVCN
ncbi:hypothetical protein F0562_026675 [Nyssa sinensis]|uniref:Late embryogenesis abundant protein LEA-2 subgroup domain-containing protein n=1 Tax=Nyssa sinensis TaxID=561372 RepID=A0A5J5BA10_9ASTE|nr:hypothetical protein F0562_026675 [Nyssa sinensis]